LAESVTIVLAAAKAVVPCLRLEGQYWGVFPKLSQNRYTKIFDVSEHDAAGCGV
jgi:hypothetical protein